MIQGGDPTGTGMGGQSIYGEKFEDEFSPELYNIRGALSAMLGRILTAVNFSLFKIKSPYSAKELSRGGWPEAIAEVYASQEEHRIWIGATLSLVSWLMKRPTTFWTRLQLLRRGLWISVEDVVIETIEVED